MMTAGVGGLNPSKLLVRPRSDIKAHDSATDANCRALFGLSQLLPLPSLYPVWLSVSLSLRRRPLTMSLPPMCLCYYHSRLSLQWPGCTFRSYQPCLIWTWPLQAVLHSLLRACSNSKNERVVILGSSSASSYSFGLVYGRSSYRFWFFTRAYLIDYRAPICMLGGPWSPLSL